jgi:hypothetical protein
MKKGETIKIKFTKNDRLKANRRASRLMEIESGIRPKSKVHKNKKKYDRKRDKKVDHAKEY